MAIIGFDIDDTVADGMSVFIPAQNKHFNKDVTIEDLNVARLHELYGVSEEEMQQYFFDSSPELLPQLVPLPGAVQLVNMLYDAGHTIYFITARPESNSKELTKNWLKQYGFKYHDLFFSKSKFELCEKLKVQIFVDDHPRVIEDIHTVGIRTIFVDSLKNKKVATSEGIIRCGTSFQIYETINAILNGDI